MEKASVFGVLIAALTVHFGLASGDCFHGWIPYGTSCYLFSNEQLTWFDASASCLSHHADLVEVEDSAEQRFLENITMRLGDGFWLGARDDVIEGTWVWSSDSLMTYTHWDDGQPDDGGPGDDDQEDCMEMKASHNWKWVDNECDEHKKYICEKT